MSEERKEHDIKVEQLAAALYSTNGPKANWEVIKDTNWAQAWRNKAAAVLEILNKVGFFT